MSEDGQGVMCVLERIPPLCGRWVGPRLWARVTGDVGGGGQGEGERAWTGAGMVGNELGDI